MNAQPSSQANPQSGSRLSQRILLALASVVSVFLSWIAIRSWLESHSFDLALIRLMDIGVLVGTGLVGTIILVRLIARPMAERAGPTQTNAVKLLLQLSGLFMIIVGVLFVTGPTGASFVSALVGVGFFGIVLGLAAQEVLGNLFSGLMLLSSRPFHINDRIALIAWQFGKFAPSLTHGWLEPSYTGIVKGISLTYTRILTDSNALLKIPNRIVTQALIMNLSHSKEGHIAMQFDVPLTVDPDKLRKTLNSILAEMTDFEGEEDSFEILEVSTSAYLIGVGYRLEKHNEREMKDLLYRALRLALLGVTQTETKNPINTK